MTGTITNTPPADIELPWHISLTHDSHQAHNRGVLCITGCQD